MVEMVGDIQITGRITGEGIELKSREGKTFVVKADDPIGKKVKMLAEGEIGGETIEEVASRCNSSRNMYYEYKRRYEREGLSGLKDSPRGPKGPSKADEEVERHIVWLRVNYPELNMYDITDEVNKKLKAKGKPGIAPSTTGKILGKHWLSKKNLARKRRRTPSPSTGSSKEE